MHCFQTNSRRPSSEAHSQDLLKIHGQPRYGQGLSASWSQSWLWTPSTPAELSALPCGGQGGWSPTAQLATPEPASPTLAQQFLPLAHRDLCSLGSDAQHVAAALGKQEGKEAESLGLGQAHKKCVRGREGGGGRKWETENMWKSVGE